MPYSDNLYSIDSDDEFPDLEPLADHGAYPVPPPPQQTQPLASPETGSQEDDQDPDHALSPADGNFPAAHATVTSSQTTGTSSHVPHVPNVLVRDPSLEQGSTAESKAREARQERQAADNSNIDSPGPAADTSTSPVVPSDDHSPSRATSPRSSSAYTPTSPTSSRATHYQPSTAGAYSAYAPSASSHSTSHVPRRSIYTPSSPFLPREAPPAYTPSPTVTSTYTASTSPTSPTASSQGQPDFSRNYQTFSQPGMGRPDETRGLLAEPESMGGPAGDDFVMVTPTWRDRVRRRVPYLNWRNCRYAAVCLVLLLVTTGFLVSSITSVKDDLKPKDPSDADPPSKAPVLEPPHMDYPPYDGDLPWSEDDHCSGKPTERVEFAFPVTYGRGHSFSLVQDIAEPDNAPPYDTHDIHVSGDVVVRRTGQGTPGPSVSVQLLKNDDAIHVTADWDRDAQALHLSVPRRLPGLDSVTWPCVSIRVTVWVPGDAVLDSLSIDNVHLGIRLMDNLALVVARYSKLTSVVGPIVAATDGTDKADNLVEDSAPDYFKLDSRVIEVKSTSAPITGYWPLYDYLGLSNIAGTIKVRVSPREEKKGAPKPATLYVKSLSGNIEVWEPVDKAQSALSSASSTDLVEPASPSAEKYIPPRDYRANIQSTSGTIKAAVAFSSACRIHSTSGSTLVELLPVLDVDASDAASNLETSTTSGTTKLEVLEPLWIGEDGKGYLPLPAPPSAPSDPTPPSLPSLPSPPSPPSPPRAPRPREDDEVVPIGPIGDSDPYRSLPLPPTLLPPTSATSLSRRDVVVVSKPPPALRCLQSRHASTSAEMRVTYPASWEGELDLGTVSGSLRVQGDGVKVIRDGKDWPGINRHLVARKGSGGGSAAGLKTTSGSIRVFVGE